LTGKAVVSATQIGTKNIRAAIDVFIADKRVENLSADLIRKYERELARVIFVKTERSIPSSASTANSSPGSAPIGMNGTHPATHATSLRSVMNHSSSFAG
jgi:hypothetical protein